MEFAQAGKDIVNEFQGMNAAGQLPSGKSACDRRAEVLIPRLDDVDEVLRLEVELSRIIIPYRIVIRTNESEQDGSRPRGRRDAAQIASLRGEANAWLSDPNYNTLRLRLEIAHAAMT